MLFGSINGRFMKFGVDKDSSNDLSDRIKNKYIIISTKGGHCDAKERLKFYGIPKANKQLELLKSVASIEHSEEIEESYLLESVVK